MQLPIAMIVAVRAVEQESASARPHAPVVPEQVAEPRFRRTRDALARALYASARAVAPREVRPVRCATSAP